VRQRDDSVGWFSRGVGPAPTAATLVGATRDSHSALIRRLRSSSLRELYGQSSGSVDARRRVARPAWDSFYNSNLMLNVVRDMERIYPEAWLIQSGNPVFDGCTLTTRETDIKVCGLCHGHFGYYTIAKVLGIDVSRIDIQAPGVNHCIWMTHFMCDGEDAYPLIDRWIEEEGEKYGESHIAEGTHDIQMSRGAVHQYHIYGRFTSKRRLVVPHRYRDEEVVVR